jgi:hypothetical protein
VKLQLFAAGAFYAPYVSQNCPALPINTCATLAIYCSNEYADTSHDFE